MSKLSSITKTASKTVFKYQGAGNDFILIDDRTLFFPHQNIDLIRRLCNRRFGVGADGLILLQNGVDFRMRIFNSDGSEAESCGNGVRCLMRFIADLGFFQKPYQISTGKGKVKASFEGDQIGVQMDPPQDLKIGLALDGKEVHLVNTGVPHAVLFVPDTALIDLQKEGAAIRSHHFFQPRGTNVNFASFKKDGSLQVRTFERGVEGETLSCGTGAAAVGVIAAQLYRLPSPIRTLFAGGEIEIHFKEKGLSDLKMVGPAQFVFQGSLAF